MKKKNFDINIMEPFLTKLEKKHLLKTFDNNEISVFGNTTTRVKKKLSSITNCSNITLTNSGSSALILGLKSLDLNENDLIITSNYTFIATINSIIHSNLRPWIFDIDREFYSIDLDNLENILNKDTYKRNGLTYHKKTNQRVSAIMPVFLWNNTRFKKIKNNFEKFNLKIISDCAGGFIQLKYNTDLIKFSDILVTSFNGNKSITSGGGGAIFSKNKKYYKKFESLSDNSKIGKYVHDDFGFNFKMTNLHASILLGQLKRIDEIILKKKNINNFYKKNLNSAKFDLIYSKDVMWLNLILVKKLKNKKTIINDLKKENFFGEFLGYYE